MREGEKTMIKPNAKDKYIKLSQALEVLDSCACWWAHEQMERIPSEDVAEVRHGKWLCELGYNGWTNRICSECGYTKTQISIVVMDYEYCPHCGARMDGE